MQSFDPNAGDVTPQDELNPRTITLGPAEDLQSGSCKLVELPEGQEIVVYNIGGEFYATGNFCPHKGARLSEGKLCGNVIECDLHGWQFDVRTGECLTVNEKILTYEVLVLEGVVRVCY